MAPRGDPMDDEFAAVLAESYRLIDEGREADWAHAMWKAERDERRRLDPTFDMPLPPPAPPSEWMRPDERERVWASVTRSIARDRSMRTQSARRASLDEMARGIGEALGRERATTRAMIREVADRCEKLEQRLLAVEQVLAARDEVSKLHAEIAELRTTLDAAKAAPRGAVLDLRPSSRTA